MDKNYFLCLCFQIDVLSSKTFLYEGTYDDGLDIYQKIIFTFVFRQNSVFDGKVLVKPGHEDKENCNSSEEKED